MLKIGLCLYLCQHTIKTISLFPNAAARCNGVSSPIFVVWTLAPRLINISTIFVWPPLAAQCNGENWWSSLKCLSKGITLTVMFHHTIQYHLWLNSFKYNDNYDIYPWFMSCSVSSSHMRTFIASPFRIQWNMSSMLLDGLFVDRKVSVNSICQSLSL